MALISPGAGQMVMSPDGRLAFYTSPGTSDLVPPFRGFKVFDVEANQISRTIVDPVIFGGDAAAPKYLAVSPDSHWLGIVGSTPLIPMSLFVYDIRKDELVKRIVPAGPQPPFFTNITVRK